MSSEIKAALILQAIGRPPEHLKKVVEDIVEKIKGEKGTKVLRAEVKDPTPLKEEPTLFSTFCEVEVEVEEPAYLMMLTFKYAPSNVEIFSPEKIELSNNNFAELLSEMARKLHQYDEVARILQMQRQQLEQKVLELEKSKEKKKVSKKK